MERTARAGDQPGWLRWSKLRPPWDQSLHSNEEAIWKEKSKPRSRRVYVQDTQSRKGSYSEYTEKA